MTYLGLRDGCVNYYMFKNVSFGVEMEMNRTGKRALPDYKSYYDLL